MRIQFLNMQGHLNIPKVLTIYCGGGYLEGIDFLLVPTHTVTMEESGKQYGYVRFIDQGKKNLPQYIQNNKLESEDVLVLKNCFFMPVRMLISVPINFQFKQADKMKLKISWTHATLSGFFQIFLRWR